MIQKLILDQSHGGSCYLINPKDYNYNPERVKEAIDSFNKLKELILKGEYGK